MKKTIKSVLAKTLAVAMAFSLVGIASGVDAEAASKPTVTKKVSVKVGKTKTVKVTSKKAVKKTTWSLDKAGKKVVTLSKKAKKSVTVKGKKKGNATLTAKVKVGKKTYTLKTKITVTKQSSPKPSNATEPTQTPSLDPSKEPEQTTAPADDPLPIGNTGKTYLPSESWDIPITELNETSMTSDLKRTEDPGTRSDAIFDKDGVTFTSTANYNNGVSFYVNPCTNEADLEVTGRGDGNLGYRNAEKDVTDYDYIHLKVTSEGEFNCRLYNGYLVEDGDAGFPGQDVDLYEGSWRGPAAQDDYMQPDDGGAGRLMKDGYATRDLFIPVDSFISGLNAEALTMIVIGLQREGMEGTLHKLELVKVVKDTPVTAITVTANKTEVENGKSANCSAAVTPDNASRAIVEWSSSDTNLATVNKYSGQVRAAADGSGKVTITATATDGSGVTGSIELTIGEQAPAPAAGDITVPITPDTVYASGCLENEDGTECTPVYGDDGSVEFTSSNQYSGGGIAFYFKADKSEVDLSNYSGVKVVLEGTAGKEVKMSAYKNATPDNYLFSATVANDYTCTLTGEEQEHTIDFASSDSWAGEAYSFLVGYNAYNENQASGDYDAGNKLYAKIKIKSITLIAK